MRIVLFSPNKGFSRACGRAAFRPHYSYGRIQEKKPWRNEEEGADNRYGAICRGHGGPIGTRNGPPPEENSTALLQTGG